MEILCECGYSINQHSYRVVGGMLRSNIPCALLKETVEARYWWNFYKKETYRLREEFIADDRCPYCLGDLRKEEVGLPDDTVSFVYRCCSCNKVWSYYGKDLTIE